MSFLPTLRQLQFLLALKQQGSFHAAATACGVTQSTLSAGIQDMEDILQQPVVDRTRRRAVRFTPLGEALLVRGEAAINSLQEVTARARYGDKPFAWPLRLGIIPTVAPYLLARVLKPLQQKFPQLVMHLHEVQSDELVERVQAGDLDAGIMAFPYETDDLKQFALYSEKFVCAVPKTMFAGKSRILLNEIQQDQLLLLSEGHCLRDHVLSACDLKGKTAANPAFSATSLSTILQLVAHGHGITLLPQMAADSLLLPASVRVLPFSPAASRQIGMVWRGHAMRETDTVLLAKALKPLITQS